MCVQSSFSSSSGIRSTVIKENYKHHAIFAIKEMKISSKNGWCFLLFGRVGVGW